MIPEIRVTDADAEADDAAIIAESLQQPERFEVIFDRYFAEVHRYAERLTARPWLYGIATNLIGKHRRRSGSALRAYRRAGLADVAERHDDQVADRVSAQQRRAELSRAGRRPDG